LVFEEGENVEEFFIIKLGVFDVTLFKYILREARKIHLLVNRRL